MTLQIREARELLAAMDAAERAGEPIHDEDADRSRGQRRVGASTTAGRRADATRWAQQLR